MQVKVPKQHHNSSNLNSKFLGRRTTCFKTVQEFNGMLCPFIIIVSYNVIQVIQSLGSTSSIFHLFCSNSLLMRSNITPSANTCLHQIHCGNNSISNTMIWYLMYLLMVQLVLLVSKLLLSNLSNHSENLIGSECTLIFVVSVNFATESHPTLWLIQFSIVTAGCAWRTTGNTLLKILHPKEIFYHQMLCL